jgi:hypothetical protein
MTDFQFAADHDWRAIGLARQTGLEHWPGEHVIVDGATGVVVRAVSHPTIVNALTDAGEYRAHVVCDTWYDVRHDTGQVRKAVGPCHLRPLEGERP